MVCNLTKNFLFTTLSHHTYIQIRNGLIILLFKKIFSPVFQRKKSIYSRDENIKFKEVTKQDPDYNPIKTKEC
jgi:hypothetical protein